jgi:hypothetical protein
MGTNLTWLIGKRLGDVAKNDWSWFFRFGDGGTIATEEGWRLVTEKGVEVAAEDHGKIFGLKVPVDAGARVIAATNARNVVEFRVIERTSDLIVRFEGGVTLEFLNLSCGYESWRAEHDGNMVVCQGGGQLTICPAGLNASEQKTVV